MKIVENFPKFKKGDIVILNPNEQGGAEEAKVIRTWYPKKGDKFTEADEIKNLGYLNSKPDLPFPQIMVKITKPFEKISDVREIGFLHINPNEYCIKK